MAYYGSQTGYVGFARQTASGVYTTPTKYMYVTSASIDPDTDLLIPDPEIGTGRAIADDVYNGPIKWTGSIEFNVRPEAFGLLAYAAMGSCTSSGIDGSNSYGHTFRLENQLVPLSIEKNVGDGLEVFGYTDCKVNTLSLSATAGELVTGSVEIIGTDETSGKTNQAETYETAPIFTYAGGTVTLDGVVTSVKEVSLELNNNIVDDDYRLGSRKLGSLVEKRREVSAKITIVPQDSSTYKKAVYGSGTATTTSGSQLTYTGSLDLHFESATGIPNTASTKYSMDINIQKAVFRAAPLPISGDDMIIEELDMLPVQGTTEDEFTIAIRNTTASY